MNRSITASVEMKRETRRRGGAEMLLEMLMEMLLEMLLDMPMCGILPSFLLTFWSSVVTMLTLSPAFCKYLSISLYLLL